MRKIWLWLFIIVFLAFSVEAKQRSFQGLTGTGTYPAVANLALDGWPVAGDAGPPIITALANRDFAHGHDNAGNYYTYVYDSTSTETETVPASESNVITPNDSAGAGRWVRLGIRTALFTPITPPAHLEGTLFYNSDKKTWTGYNDISGTSMEMCREDRARVYNDTGGDLLDGKVVYISGVDTDTPEVSLAQPDEFDKSRIIGVITGTIADGNQGEATYFGEVNNIDTDGLSVGPVYLDHDGTMTSTKPTGSHFTVIIGNVLIVNASTGKLFVAPSVSNITVEVTDTNGFPNRDDTALSFTDGSLTFAITPTDTDFHYYINGDNVARTTTDDVILTDVEGLHVIYYDDLDGTLLAIANPNDGQIGTLVRTKTIVAYIYWDATNLVGTYFADERHGISMSPQTHTYLHFTQGAKWLQGLGLGDFDADQGTPTTASAQFSVATGLTVDEDITTSYSTIASTVGLPIYYLDGANGDMRRTTQTGFSVKAGTGTGNPLWNEWTGAIWQTTEIGDNNYVLYHIFGANGYSGEDQQISIMGQAVYTTIPSARAGATTEIANILAGFPFEEIVPLGTVIFQGNTSYVNDVNARVRTDGEANDYVDWRTTDLAQGVAASSHQNLTDLEKAASGSNWGHIDDLAQTLAGVKTFSSSPIVPAPTTDLQAATKKYVDDNSGGSGDVTKVGTPSNTQVAVWTGDGTLGFLSGFTHDGSNFLIPGDFGSDGVRINKGWFTDIETTNGIVVTQGVTAQYIEIYEASGDGTNKHRITAQAFGSDWNSLWPDYQIGFLAFASVNSSGLAVAAGIADWYAYDPIPIAWMNGGTSEPDALDITTRTPYAYRTFDPTADEDLNFVWFVPSDLSGTTVQFRVKYLVTNATGPSAEGVAFGLSGVSLGDNDLTNAAKGTVVVITDPTITAVQHDILITGWSGDVTITNLLAGEVAEVALIRDVSDAADTYAQVVGVFAIEIRYVRNVAR